MSLFSLFKKPPQPSLPPLGRLSIDLVKCSCGEMRVGEEIGNPAESLFPGPDVEIVDAAQGFEAGSKAGRLDYLFIDLTKFPGVFLKNGNTLPLTAGWTEAQVVADFGDYYWRDEDGDEVILFYEDGRIERQFEFVEGKLVYITISQEPILAGEAQRKAYRCTKPWPPEKGCESTKV